MAEKATTKAEEALVDSKGKVRILVYGTLKSPHYNNDLLRRCHAEFLGYDYIAGRFKLIDLGPFPACHFLESDANVNVNNHIYGEIWALPDEGLAEVDYLEGHPFFYERKKMWSQRMNLRVWAYFMQAKYGTDKAKVLKDGIWKPSDEEIAFWNKYDESQKQQS